MARKCWVFRPFRPDLTILNATLGKAARWSQSARLQLPMEEATAKGSVSTELDQSNVPDTGEAYAARSAAFFPNFIEPFLPIPTAPNRTSSSGVLRSANR